MSSGLRTSTARPAQYTADRSSSPTTPRASAKVTTLPSATGNPAPRNTRAKAAANRSPLSPLAEPAVKVVAPAAAFTGGSLWGTSGATLHRGADQLAHPGRPHPFLVLAVL